jgi:serine/threonine protein kinase
MKKLNENILSNQNPIIDRLIKNLEKKGIKVNGSDYIGSGAYGYVYLYVKRKKEYVLKVTPHVNIVDVDRLNLIINAKPKYIVRVYDYFFSEDPEFDHIDEYAIIVMEKLETDQNLYKQKYKYFLDKVHDAINDFNNNEIEFNEFKEILKESIYGNNSAEEKKFKTDIVNGLLWLARRGTMIDEIHAGNVGYDSKSNTYKLIDIDSNE